MNYPKISIIFPTYNGWQDTKDCLKSIKKLNYPQDKLETIIIDNASTDGTVEMLRKLIKKNKLIKLIENKKNLGFAKAVNLGIKKSKGDYILITNNDVVFDQNYLKNLVQFLQKNPDVGIVGGKVYYKKPKNKIAFAGARFNFYTGFLRLDKDPNKTTETDWVPGCNLLTRKEVLTKIGDFDEKFFFYFEDFDLCLRAKKIGYKVTYYPKALMYHGEGAAIERERWQKKSEFYYQGKTRFLFKHATKIQLIIALLYQFLLGLHYQFLILKYQNYTPAIKALVKTIKDRASE